jgi:DNA modification methylase
MPCSTRWPGRRATSYGVSYTGKTARALTIQNDAADGLDQLLAEAFAAVDGHLVAGARLYVAHPAGALSAKFIAAFLDQGWRLAQTLVWLKDSMVLGHADYHYRHEPILYGYKPGSGRLGRGGKGWYGDDAQTSVFEVSRPKAAREHPTMKPPALIEAALGNSTRRNHVVLDPFAGSGSTLVACELTGRQARLIELDPGYCDVILVRFEALTGVKGERVDA